ncbi:uncharacterized protein LOC117291906 isoform X2 [Asterias rubens]|uniref:uncharacterized protein LOC117291906 isoform X2 n=1 Tax=Asterias rubens TaxID=7604 RepID=UPI0014552353|nr:uncharacterized protein LOC117291906 isoform X2 [Asterias rubens]
MATNCFFCKRTNFLIKHKIKSILTQESAINCLNLTNLEFEEGIMCPECRKVVYFYGRKIKKKRKKSIGFVNFVVRIMIKPNTKIDFQNGIPKNLTDSTTQQPHSHEGEGGEGESREPVHGDLSPTWDGISEYDPEHDEEVARMEVDEEPKPKVQRSSLKEVLITYIKNAHYDKAVACMYKLRGGRKAIHKFVQKQIHQEFVEVGRPPKRILPLTSEVTVENLKKFKWSNVMEEVTTKMPFTTTTLTGMMPSLSTLMHQHERRKTGKASRPRLTNKEAKKKWNLKAGVTVAMMLYANSHQIYKFWPAVVGIEMRREKSSLKMFDLFHRIGLSQNIHAGVFSQRRTSTLGDDDPPLPDTVPVNTES